MRESRLRRFVGGLGFGYVNTAVVVVAGLWLTPYLLRHLGSHDYGLWLLGAQVLVYLSLMDLGIVQLVPRDVAIADGRADGDYSELQAIIGQTARLVLWQMPAVAIIGSLVIWLLPSEWAPLRGPLACVVVAFILTFPLRMFNAILQGRQDLAFLGGVQLVAWTAGAAVTVAGVAAGLGLYSLAFGWVTTQCITAFVAWRRLMTVHRDVLPLDFRPWRSPRRRIRSAAAPGSASTRSRKCCSAAPIWSSSESCSGLKPSCLTSVRANC